MPNEYVKFDYAAHGDTDDAALLTRLTDMFSAMTGALSNFVVQQAPTQYAVGVRQMCWGIVRNSVTNTRYLFVLVNRNAPAAAFDAAVKYNAAGLTDGGLYVSIFGNVEQPDTPSLPDTPLVSTFINQSGGKVPFRLHSAVGKLGDNIGASAHRFHFMQPGFGADPTTLMIAYEHTVGTLHGLCILSDGAFGTYSANGKAFHATDSNRQLLLSIDSTITNLEIAVIGPNGRVEECSYDAPFAWLDEPTVQSNANGPFPFESLRVFAPGQTSAIVLDSSAKGVIDPQVIRQMNSALAAKTLLDQGGTLDTAIVMFLGLVVRWHDDWNNIDT
jgi:hypothetical protein